MKAMESLKVKHLVKVDKKCDSKKKQDKVNKKSLQNSSTQVVSNGHSI